LAKAIRIGIVRVQYLLRGRYQMSAGSSKWTKGIAMLAAVAAVGISLPERPASAQLQAVPRAGFTFTHKLTQRVNVESIDSDSRTGIFVLPDGHWVNLSIADNVPGIDKIEDGSFVNITYTEVVTILNLKRKGVGSQAARKDSMPMAPEPGEDPVRFTYTVVAVDLAINTISVIGGMGGQVHTYPVTNAARRELLKGAKVGDVLIGMTTPLTITAITPAN
jgi:hypothetical protein